ncbi:hypothetical protein Gotur_001137 [Gossypium turneri]
MQMQTSFTGKKMSGTKNLFQRLFVTPWKQHEPSSDSSIPGWAQLARLHGGHGLELEEVLTNGANTQSVLPAEFAWPHRAIDELRLILVGKRVEPTNYFYTFCKLKPRSWSSKSTGIQEGSTSTPINIVGADESWEGSGSSRKRQRTTAGSANIVLSSECFSFPTCRMNLNSNSDNN